MNEKEAKKMTEKARDGTMAMAKITGGEEIAAHHKKKGEDKKNAFHEAGDLGFY